MAALLTSVLDNTSKVIEYTSSCQRLGIKVLPPDINVSAAASPSIATASASGLNAVKSVGRNLIDSVVRSAKDRPYRSLYDFCRRLHGGRTESPRAGKPHRQAPSMRWSPAAVL